MMLTMTGTTVISKLLGKHPTTSLLRTHINYNEGSTFN